MIKRPTRGHGDTETRRHGDTETRGISTPRRVAASPRLPAGQATTEMVLILPLLVMLIGGAMGIGYLCVQGLKVQAAANLAARIQGQERVAGGSNIGSITTINGTEGSGDEIPGSGNLSADALAGMKHNPGSNSVFGKYYQAVEGLFSSSEQKGLLIPKPTIGQDTDQVQVIRQTTPIKVFSLTVPGVKLEAKAYGGEDPRMYGLPRWGCTGNGTCDSSNAFWHDIIKEKN